MPRTAKRECDFCDSPIERTYLEHIEHNLSEHPGLFARFAKAALDLERAQP